jgi:hypothetical protein
MQRSKRASMLQCMYIAYPVLIYTVISCTMLLLFFIFPTNYHFYGAHFPQTYNHIRLWNPLALLLLQPHKHTMLVLFWSQRFMGTGKFISTILNFCKWICIWIEKSIYASNKHVKGSKNKQQKIIHKSLLPCNSSNKKEDSSKVYMKSVNEFA